MNRGRLVALDTPARLREGMRDPVLEVRTPDALKVVESLAGAPDVRAAGLFGRAVHVTMRDSPGVVTALRDRLAALGLRIEGVTRIEPSLEHVFIAAVQAAGGATND